MGLLNKINDIFKRNIFEDGESLEVIRGASRGNLLPIKNLIDSLTALKISGTLYIGYPVLSSADNNEVIDALLISKSIGLLAFNFPNTLQSIDELCDIQDRIMYTFEANLKKHEELRNGRSLIITPQIVTYVEDIDKFNPQNKTYIFADSNSLGKTLKKIKNELDDDQLKRINSAIQKVSSLKPKNPRENAITNGSKGFILKQIEKEIANLDKWQKQASIEVPDGPQRIRGLAGSGKTVVLALKAAYLHTNYPEWKIAVTFYTRSLKQQFQELIEKFTYAHSENKPNWDKIEILHAWGSLSEKGIYSEASQKAGLKPMNFQTAKEMSPNDPFRFVCEQLNNEIKDKNIEMYDAILVDEAQDFPDTFFKILYKMAKGDKKIVWAYDELQNLSGSTMPSINNLFDDNITVDNFKNEVGRPRKDIVLPICYRNTPWAITVAHALGFGIYRKGGLVQFFEQLDLWKDVGYDVDKPMDFGVDVSLVRSKGSYPEYFDKYITKTDAVQVNTFETVSEQYTKLAQSIKENIEKDELTPQDIMIILPDAYTAQKEYVRLSKVLSEYNIPAHLAGVSTNRDTFHIDNSVTVTSIYRAKGNEAAMVYIVNSEYCYTGLNLPCLRNTLFTAITRSRAWVRIFGVGLKMKLLEEEINSVIDKDFKLMFTIPSKEVLRNLRKINRDLSEDDNFVKEASKLIQNGATEDDLHQVIRELFEN